MIDYDELTAEEKADIRAALTSFMIVEQTPISFSLPCEDGARMRRAQDRAFEIGILAFILKHHKWQNFSDNWEIVTAKDKWGLIRKV